MGKTNRMFGAAGRYGSSSQLAISVALALALNAGAPAIAQDTVAAPQDTPATPQETEVDAAGVEDIVVTAQKRSENLQQVPIAVAAFTSETLEQSGVTSPQDLQAIVPGLVTQQRVGSAAPSLRGIGSIDPSFASEGVISTYVDGVYIPALGAGTFSFNNIERIEVLKGPQGTLFGRNSVGGLLNIVTRKPEHEFSGQMELGYASYQTVTARGYVTGGIAPNLAADLAVTFRHQGEGWGRNLDTGAEVYFNDNFGIRSKWLYQRGGTEITLSADYNRNEDDTSVGFTPYFPDGNLTVPFPPIATRGAGFYDRTGRGPTFNTVKQGGVSLRVTQDLGFADLTSVTAYRRSHQYEGFDQDMTAATLLDIEQTIRSRDFSQELQLASNSTNPVSWILGLYYLRHDSSLDPQKTTSPIAVQELSARQTTDSIAGFAQGTARLAEGTNLTVGLRYTRDRQAYSAVPLHSVLVAPPPRISGDVTFPKLTWRVALDQDLGPDTMAYVSYNRGFKSGQWNATLPVPTSTDPEVLDAYEIGFKSRFLDRRVQLNASAFRYDYSNIQYNRIISGVIIVANAASAQFYGLDVDLQVAPTDGLRFNLGAVYLAKRKYTSFPGAQFFVPNAGYPTRLCGAPFFGVTPLCLATADLSGKTVIQSPALSLNGSIDYTLKTTGAAINFNVTGNYTSRITRTINGSMTEPGHVLLNAQIRLDLERAPLSFTGWCKNVLDVQSHAFGAAINFGYIGGVAPPRTCGVSAGVSF